MRLPKALHTELTCGFQLRVSSMVTPSTSFCLFWTRFHNIHLFKSSLLIFFLCLVPIKLTEDFTTLTFNLLHVSQLII